MDAGKVLIVNLGRSDDETRRLIGSLITTGLEQAAITRAEDRRHFYLYLDEFQDFCANDGGRRRLVKPIIAQHLFGRQQATRPLQPVLGCVHISSLPRIVYLIFSSN